MIIPIGKYVGKHVSEVPTTYLTHALETFPMSEELTNALIDELDKRIPMIKEYHYGLLDNSF